MIGVGAAAAATPSLQPAATERTWQQLVQRPRTLALTDANEVTASHREVETFAIYVVYRAASRNIVTASRIEVARFLDGEFHVTGQEILDGDRDIGDPNIVDSDRLIVSSTNIE